VAQGQALHTRSAVEIKAIFAAEEKGVPFLLWRDGSGEQQIFELSGRERVTLGRAEACHVVLGADNEVSRTHAELERVAERWTVSDDGLSSYGTYLQGVRISGRNRLHDGDVLRLGSTIVEFRNPADDIGQETSAAAQPDVGRLTDRQRDVLLALCRPYKHNSGFANPASNKEIAEELVLTVPAVKAQIRAISRVLEADDLPRGRQRVRLVERAFALGLVSKRDL
jgi:hypothetical protein